MSKPKISVRDAIRDTLKNYNTEVLILYLEETSKELAVRHNLLMFEAVKKT